VRGPYSSEKMRSWYVRGYLTRDLQCTRDNHGSVFHKLSDYYADTEPFLEGENPDHTLTGLLALVNALSTEVHSV